MNSIAILVFAVFACASAQVWKTPDFAGNTRNEPYYKVYKPRHPRDVTWDKQVGDSGKVFGTLGSDNQGPFGKAGYQHEFFDDGRGKLQGQAYGERKLGADSTSFGGKLDWSNQDAHAVLDVSKPLGGRGFSATGSGVWDLDKNTHLSAGGQYSNQFGRPDYGVLAKFSHDW